MFRRGLMLVAALVVALSCGCKDSDESSASPDDPDVLVHGKPGESGEPLIKLSLTRYQSFRTFTAACHWQLSVAGNTTKDATVRWITYESPNMFKVTSPGFMGFSTTAVCDGAKMVEKSSNESAQSYPPPDSIASADAIVMMNPMFCGSLLYKFFGGTVYYPQIVDDRLGPATYGKEEKAGKETAQHVHFYAVGDYGNTDMLIGEKSGLIYRIVFDNDGLVKKAASEHSSVPGQMAKSKFVEDYSGIKVNPELEDSAFSTASIDKSEDEPKKEPKKIAPPIAREAPDFQVSPLNETLPLKLADLKGYPSIIVFWATWSASAEDALIILERVSQAFKSKGLKVITITDEDAAKVKPFLQDKKIDLPTYFDSDDDAASAYRVNGMPTIAFLDKDAKLQDYLSGPQSAADIVAGLAAIGVITNDVNQPIP